MRKRTLLWSGDCERSFLSRFDLFLRLRFLSSRSDSLSLLDDDDEEDDDESLSESLGFGLDFEIRLDFLPR